MTSISQAQRRSQFGLFLLTQLIFILTGNVRAAGLVDGFAPAGESHMTLGGIRAVASQGDGKTLLGGQFDHIGEAQVDNLARFMKDGSLDTTFGASTTGTVEDIQVQSDGRILIAGSFTRVNGISRYALARLNTDGSFDSSLAVTVNGIAYAVLAMPDGEIVLGGMFNRVNGITCSGIVRLDSVGGIVDTYGGGLGISEKVGAIARQADGSVVIGGRFSSVGGVTRSNLARFTPTGALDTSLTAGTNSEVFCVMVAKTGHILFGGMFTQAGGSARNYLARCLASGAFDTGFAPPMGYRVYELASQLDGKFLVACSSYGGNDSKWLHRFTSSGAYDQTFNPRMNGGVDAMRTRSDGRINIAGKFTTVDGQTRYGIARLYGYRVLDTDTQNITINEGADATIDVKGLGGATFQWTKDGMPLVTSDRIKVGSTGRVSISRAVATDEGEYICTATLGDVTQITDSIDLTVRLKPVIQNTGLPAAIVSGVYILPISASGDPTSYNVTGLPSGMTFNKATGVISGTPNVSGRFEVRVSAKNAAGTSDVQKFTLIIATMPDGTTGTFSGLVARTTEVNSGLGGLLTLSVGSTGTFTGRLKNGTESHRIEGRCSTPLTGEPTALLTISRDGLSALTLSLSFNGMTGVATGSLTDGVNTTSLNLRRHSWTSGSAAAYAGAYNVVNEIPAGSVNDLGQPQGSGFQRMTVTAGGKVSGTGRTPEGLSYTFSSTMWADGSVPQFLLLYSTKGSIIGLPRITTGATLADNRVTGYIEHFKIGPTSGSDRTYAGGIPNLRRAVDGSAWIKPTTAFPIVMKKVDQPSNASLSFSKGGIETAAQFSDTDQVFRITKSNAAQFAAASAGNPCKVKMTITPSTGEFTGSVVLEDTVSSKTVSRTMTYRGLMLSHEAKGYGYFTLPGLTPSITSSSILSGKVILN